MRCDVIRGQHNFGEDSLVGAVEPVRADAREDHHSARFDLFEAGLDLRPVRVVRELHVGSPSRADVRATADVLGPRQIAVDVRRPVADRAVERPQLDLDHVHPDVFHRVQNCFELRVRSVDAGGPQRAAAHRERHPVQQQAAPVGSRRDREGA